MIGIGVLVPVNPGGAPPPPSSRPVGRAALSIRELGIQVIFGDQIFRRGEDVWISGLSALPDRWESVTCPIHALHDRYPSQRRAENYARVQSMLGSLPMGNPRSLTLLCRDKLASQEHLASHGVPMPAVEADPTTWSSCLSSWGSGFLKPRYGALGIGVRRVKPGDPLPVELESVVPGRPDPAILQRAVLPPSGWAGRSVRALCQRLPGGGWHLCPPVLRQSREDAVVNASRGASVHPAEDVLSSETMAQIASVCSAACAALSAHPDGHLLVEVGLDLVLDAAGVPHLIECNSRPRGRLEVLASQWPDRFGSAHLAACGRPLRYLASL